MFRASGRLRNFQYRALLPIVDIVRQANELRSCELGRAHELDSGIVEVSRQVRDALSDLRITATDTLATKILLGTLACTPAYDRFLLKGARERGWRQGVEELSHLCPAAVPDPEFVSFCDVVQEAGQNVPAMRLLDAYLSYLGRFGEA